MSTTLSREYLAESRQASLYAAETITYFGALVAVELRFWSRRMKAAGFWIDDWLIVAAMVCTYYSSNDELSNKILGVCHSNAC